MRVSSSLLDAREESALEPAGDWIAGLLTDVLATSLCVLAVALLGMAMLTGRIAPRRGFQVVLGCFLVLGASSLVGDLRDFAIGSDRRAPVPLVLELEPKAPMPPAEYNPYAHASLRKK